MVILHTKYFNQLVLHHSPDEHVLVRLLTTSIFILLVVSSCPYFSLFISTILCILRIVDNFNNSLQYVVQIFSSLSFLLLIMCTKANLSLIFFLIFSLHFILENFYQMIYLLLSCVFEIVSLS